MLTSEHLAGTSEARLDFVEDEEDAILIADLADCLKVTWWWGHVAAFSENGLDNDGGGI